MAKYDFVIAVGGAPGQGIDTVGKSMSQICARHGLHVYTYSAYQSLIRGGHTFLTVRISSEPVANHGDKIDMIIALDRNSLEVHLPHVAPGGAIIYNTDDVKTAPERDDIQLCPISYSELSNATDRRKLMLNICMFGVALKMVGGDLAVLEDIINLTFGRKGQALVDANIAVAQTLATITQQNISPPLKLSLKNRNLLSLLLMEIRLWQWAAQPQASNSTLPIL